MWWPDKSWCAQRCGPSSIPGVPTAGPGPVRPFEAPISLLYVINGRPMALRAAAGGSGSGSMRV